jgi:aspartate/methionine/tyrosine aminotransferase
MSTSESTRYPIAAVRERVRRHAGQVLDFAVGRHREPTPAGLQEMIRDHGDRSLLTSCSQDEIDAFSTTAATMLERTYGVRVAPAAILSVPGGRTAMSFLASSLIGPGDGVAVVEPAYPAFARVADQLRGRVHTVPLDPDRNFEPDPTTLAADVTADIAFAALNYPNNPTGAVIGAEALADLLGHFRPGTIVFNDATYGPLTFDIPPWSLLAASGAAAENLRLVELHSLAKLFVLGPLPVAFLVGEDQIIAELREFSEFAWSDQSSLQVRVALRCLEDGDQFTRMREVFKERLKRLHTTLQTLGFAPFPAKSGMYLVCRVPSAIGGRRVSSAGEAAEVLLARHGVAVVPWEIEPHSYLRFSAQYLEEDLEAFAKLGPLAT